MIPPPSARNGPGIEQRVTAPLMALGKLGGILESAGEVDRFDRTVPVFQADVLQAGAGGLELDEDGVTN